METLRLLNKRKVKDILIQLKERYDADFDLDYMFYMNSKGRVFLLSKKFKDFDNTSLNINSLGLYFANVDREIRLSVEGTQLIGKFAKKNVVEISDEELRKWLRGEDLEIETNLNGFVFVKNKEDFYGSGKIASNRLLNFVPKEKRICVV